MLKETLLENPPVVSNAAAPSLSDAAGPVTPHRTV